MPGGRGAMKPGWGKKFRGCGHRMTAPRKVIIEILSDTDKHLSAEDIYMKVRNMDSIVGLTTIYRTLEILRQMGTVIKFDFGDGRARYELVEGPQGAHHHHLVCTECGRVINYTEFLDVELDFLERVEKGLSGKYRFDIKNHIIQFYGVCDKCRKENKKKGV